MDEIEIKKGTNKFGVGFIIICVLLFAVIVVAIIYNSKAISKGVDSAKSAYLEVENRVEKEQMDRFYQIGYDVAEEQYHVSNQVNLVIADVKEIANLEVLQVSDVEFVCVDSSENNQNITAWLEVPGTGVFTVNLKEAEYVVDNSRKFILVRIPYPELSNSKVDYSNVRKLLFKNDWKNDSVSEGEDLARKMLNDGYLLIHKEFASNDRFYSNAMKAAKSIVESLVKEYNSEVEDLIVNVEFV